MGLHNMYSTKQCVCACFVGSPCHGPHAVIMSENTPESISQNEMDAWSRVINKRKAEWKTLPPNKLLAIIHDPWSREQSPPQIEDPSERAEWLMRSIFSLSINRKVPPDKRRASWACMQNVLAQLDEACSKNRNTENGYLNMELHVSSEVPQEIVVAKRQPGQPRNLFALTPNSNLNSVALAQQSVATLPPRDTGTEARASPSGISSKQAAVSSSASSFTAKKPSLPLEPAASLVTKPVSSTAKEPAASQQSPPQRQQSVSPQREQSAQQQEQPSSLPVARTHPSDVSPLQPETSIGVEEPRRSPTAPSVTAPHTPEQQKTAANEQVNGMGSFHSSNARVTPNDAAHEKDRAVQEKANAPHPAPPLLRPLPPTTISFKADYQKFTCALESWPSVRVVFRPMMLSDQEISRTMERLRIWDPYWHVEELVCLNQTFPVTDCFPKYEVVKKQSQRQHNILKIQQAAECDVSVTRSMLVRDWGKPRSSMRYKHGEMRLLVRMLPLRLAKQKNRPRADTHLWPKGTFVQLNSTPVTILQRKQQSHEPTEWKYMSAMLDLTPRVLRPNITNKLQFYFLDSEPYAICVALCSYVSPDVVYKNIMSEIINKLSMEDAKAKALENANRQTVVLEDAEHRDEVNSFIFPLTCPVSRQLLLTPVRGEQCSHWQCFDLRNFIESNTHVTGTRWHCPVCAKVVSCHDLQYCPLTASLLKEFEGQATPTRDRVQFFSDGTWKLLGEAKKWHANKRPANDTNGNGAKRPRSDGNVAAPKGAPEIIEIL